MSSLTHSPKKIIVISLISTILTAVPLLHSNDVYGQIPGISPSQQPQQELKPENLAQKTSFTTYRDPQGKFSVDYPSDWIVKPRQNRFEQFDVTFVSPGSSVSNGVVTIKFDNTSGSTTAVTEDRNSVAQLPTIFETFLNGFSSTVPGYRQIGEIS